METVGHPNSVPWMKGKVVLGTLEAKVVTPEELQDAIVNDKDIEFCNKICFASYIACHAISKMMQTSSSLSVLPNGITKITLKKKDSGDKS